jgi:hypothetical protein
MPIRPDSASVRRHRLPGSPQRPPTHRGLLRAARRATARADPARLGTRMTNPADRSGRRRTNTPRPGRAAAPRPRRPVSPLHHARRASPTDQGTATGPAGLGTRTTAIPTRLTAAPADTRTRPVPATPQYPARAGTAALLRRARHPSRAAQGRMPPRSSRPRSGTSRRAGGSTPLQAAAADPPGVREPGLGVRGLSTRRALRAARRRTVPPAECSR